jgi:hypothetical protein
MEILTSELFFKNWCDVVQSRKEYLLKIWRDARIFTPYIRSDQNSVLKEVADKLQLKCYPYDYYCIDGILYKEEDLVPDISPSTTWFRHIRVAFEHENYFKSGLYKEVSHLLITNCDIKVLVTYYPAGDYYPELEYLHRIIKGSGYSESLSEKENFLLIIGDEADFTWDGYIYKDDNWKLINSEIDNT